MSGQQQTVKVEIAVYDFIDGRFVPKTTSSSSISVSTSSSSNSSGGSTGSTSTSSTLVNHTCE
ncbi:hypothetical protein I204_05185 [Kwoniella mangroviensis CBS 8886]|nr:hypothetical protein I204_05185 [Kwoniella mangroviensis CBS 8886]